MEEDEFANIGPSWIGNLAFDIRDNTAQPDDVELMMAYYCHLYQSSEGIPPKTLHLSPIEEREWIRELLKGVDDLLDEMVD